jgi:hypothetical protein
MPARELSVFSHRLIVAASAINQTRYWKIVPTTGIDHLQQADILPVAILPHLGEHAAAWLALRPVEGRFSMRSVKRAAPSSGPHAE